jgi:hypothetical protein
LIEDSSAEFDHLKLDLVKRLDTLKKCLKGAATATGAKRDIENIVARLYPEIVGERLDTVVSNLLSGFQSAAEKGLEIFDRHLSPQMQYYILRARFSIFQVPDVTPDDIESEFWTKDFFGCSPEEFSNAIIDEWISYKRDWNMRYNAKKDWFNEYPGGNYQYWTNKESEWPNLCHVAKWYANWPTSSIAAERTFAEARIVTTSLKGAQAWQTFNRELKLRVNKAIVLDMLQRSLSKSVEMQKSV